MKDVVLNIQKNDTKQIYVGLLEEVKKDHHYLLNCSVPHIYNPYILDPFFGLFGFGLFAFSSMLLVFIVAMTIKQNKKLREIHPSMLIGLIAVCEFIIAWNLFIYYVGSAKFACYFGVSKLVIFWSNLPKVFCNFIVKELGIIFDQSFENYHGFKLMNEKEALWLIERSNIICFEVFQMLVLCLNMMMCIDIFKVFKDPFYPTGRRTKWYIISSCIIVLICYPQSKSILLSSDDFFIMFVMPLVTNTAPEIGSEGAIAAVYNEYVKSAVHTCIILCYMAIANYSISFIRNMRLQKERSISQTYVLEFLEKHMMYIQVFTIIWMGYLTSMYFSLDSFVTRNIKLVENPSEQQ